MEIHIQQNDIRSECSGLGYKLVGGRDHLYLTEMHRQKYSERRTDSGIVIYYEYFRFGHGHVDCVFKIIAEISDC